MTRPSDGGPAFPLSCGCEYAAADGPLVRACPNKVMVGNAVAVRQAAALWQHPVEHVLGISRRAG